MAGILLKSIFLMLLMWRDKHRVPGGWCSFVTSSFHILTSWAWAQIWGVIWACQISGSPITHPPLRCLLARAPALMQITGIYEGYFVRCGVETITGNPIPLWCTPLHLFPPSLRELIWRSIRAPYPMLLSDPRPPNLSLINYRCYV